MRQQQGGRLVRPVQVLQHQHDRPRSRRVREQRAGGLEQAEALGPPRRRWPARRGPGAAARARERAARARRRARRPGRAAPRATPPRRTDRTPRRTAGRRSAPPRDSGRGAPPRPPRERRGRARSPAASCRCPGSPAITASRPDPSRASDHWARSQPSESSRPTNGLRSRRASAAGSGGSGSAATDAGAPACAWMASSSRRVSREGATCSSVRRRRARSSKATRAADDLPRGDQAPDELAVGVLPQRIELDAATRDANGVLQRAGCLGVRGQALQHVAEAAAVRLAGLVDPLRVESRQQLAVAQIDGLLQPPLPDEPLELPGVHADAVADEPDHVARRHERRPRPPRRARAGRRRARSAGSCARSSRAHRARSDRRPPSAGACPGGGRASRAASMPAGARASAMRRRPTRARRRRTGARGAWRQAISGPSTQPLIWP